MITKLRGNIFQILLRKGIPVLADIFIYFQFSNISLGTIKMAKCSNSKGVNFVPKSSFKLSSIKTKLTSVTIASVKQNRNKCNTTYLSHVLPQKGNYHNMQEILI